MIKIEVTSIKGELHLEDKIMDVKLNSKANYQHLSRHNGMLIGNCNWNVCNLEICNWKVVIGMLTGSCRDRLGYRT